MSRHDRKWDPAKDRAFVEDVRHKLTRSTHDHANEKLKEKVRRLNAVDYVLLGLLWLAFAAATQGAPIGLVALFACAVVAVWIWVGAFSRAPRCPEVADVLHGAKDPRLYGVLASYGLDDDQVVQTLARSYLTRVLPHVRPEYGELLTSSEVAALDALLVGYIPAGLCVDLLGAVERTRDVRLLQAARQVARGDCPAGRSRRVRDAAESCCLALERQLEILRKSGALLRPAEESNDAHLLLPAEGAGAASQQLLRPAGSADHEV